MPPPGRRGQADPPPRTRSERPDRGAAVRPVCAAACVRAAGVGAESAGLDPGARPSGPAAVAGGRDLPWPRRDRPDDRASPSTSANRSRLSRGAGARGGQRVGHPDRSAIGHGGSLAGCGLLRVLRSADLLDLFPQRRTGIFAELRCRLAGCRGTPPWTAPGAGPARPRRRVRGCVRQDHGRACRPGPEVRCGDGDEERRDRSSSSSRVTQRRRKAGGMVRSPLLVMITRQLRLRAIWSEARHIDRVAVEWGQQVVGQVRFGLVDLVEQHDRAALGRRRGSIRRSFARGRWPRRPSRARTPTRARRAPGRRRRDHRPSTCGVAQPFDGVEARDQVVHPGPRVMVVWTSAQPSRRATSSASVDLPDPGEPVTSNGRRVIMRDVDRVHDPRIVVDVSRLASPSGIRRRRRGRTARRRIWRSPVNPGCRSR